MAKAVCKPKTGWEYTNNPEWYRTREYSQRLLAQLRRNFHALQTDADQYTRGKLVATNLILGQISDSLQATNLIPKEDK